MAHLSSNGCLSFTMDIKIRIKAGLGGSEKNILQNILCNYAYHVLWVKQKLPDGAITLEKASWFFSFPRMHSPRATMVSVKMSAGIPTAIRILENLSNSPHCFMDD